MDQDELKRKLMGLWEKTTHNSKESLSALFDYYFDINLIEYQETDGRVVGAVCGIPYNFGSGKYRLKGLYIITLSSEEGFRKKGLLAELLHKFNKRVKRDFDFTFLVPHTELLADYFGSQGYLSSFFILEERFTPLHDFRNDYFLSLKDTDERIKNLKLKLIDQLTVNIKENTDFSDSKIIEFIHEIENKGRSAVSLIHRDDDLLYLFSSESLRDLSCFISYDSDKRITGIAFTQKEDIKRIKIVAYYVSDSSSYFSLLDYINHYFPDYSISVVKTESKQQPVALIQDTYASANPLGGDLDNTFEVIELPFNFNKLLQPLGMVRLLRFDNIMEYIAATRSDVSFKLYIRDNEISEKSLNTFEANGSEESASETIENDEKLVIEVKNGKCTFTALKENKKDTSILNLTVKEVSELLLRKKDTTNLIMEAFGIPRLNLQMRLLPC